MNMLFHLIYFKITMAWEPSQAHSVALFWREVLKIFAALNLIRKNMSKRF